MKTRKQYMAKEVTHDEYYSQFVNDSVLSYVRDAIGKARILKSKDPHFNDIALSKWDRLAPSIRMMCGHAICKANESNGLSLSDCVCTAKQAARIIKEQGA